jgi:hypothetical protein
LTPGAGFTSGSEYGSLRVTPDGERIFVTAWHLGSPFPGFPDGLSIFRRDPATGALGNVEAVLEEAGWPPTDGLSQPSSIAFTADGKFAYLGAYADRSLTAFRVRPFCASAPRASCRQTTKPGTLSLVVRAFTDPARDTLHWKWRHGEETPAAAFGDPSSDTDFVFCVHTQSADAWRPVIELSAPVAEDCAPGGPCWKKRGNPAGTKGWVYRDRARRNDGLGEIKLVPGLDGRASIALSGKGAALALPTLPLVTIDALSAEIVSGDGECWGAGYAAPFLRSDGRQLSDRSD